MNSIIDYTRLEVTTEKIPFFDVESSLATVKEKREMEQEITCQAAPRVELNFEILARSGYLAPTSIPIRSPSQINLIEEYGFLKYWVLQNKKLLESSIIKEGALATFSNLMMITSALPGEGKTFTSFNLAISMATAWDNTSVLLIDGDLAGRSLTKLVGLSDAPGLTDILLGIQTNLHEVITHTNVPNLKLIPAGHSYYNAMNLLEIERMKDLIYEISTRYGNRIVLFDTMPLLSNNQVLFLASLMGIILVVVEEGKTPKRAIKEAISLLDESKVTGMILNKCSQKNR